MEINRGQESNFVIYIDLNNLQSQNITLTWKSTRDSLLGTKSGHKVQPLICEMGYILRANVHIEDDLEA